MADIYEFDPDEGRYEGVYRKLRRSVLSWANTHAGSDIVSLVMNVPDFFYLLVKLSSSDEVPSKNKKQILLALGYIVSPINLIPDVLGGLGWLDDLYVALLAVDSLINSVGVEVAARYWPGEIDVLLRIKDTLDLLDEKLGSGAIKRLAEKIGIGR